MSDATLAYASARRLPGGFATDLRGIALDSEGRVHVVGDRALRILDSAGSLVREWPTSRPGHCVAVDAAGRVWVGEAEQVEVFEAGGALAETRRDTGRLGLVTAIGFAGNDVLFADAGARCIHRYTRDGRFVNDIGDQHRKGGFHIPNGVVDFAVDADGVVHVANPGMHRVERYDAAGELLGRFGRFDGRDPAGFGGCCNPTNVAVDARGRVVVTEKAGPRAKAYDGDGQLLSVIADDVFDPAAKNMDVAVDATGRVYVADTARLEILVFEPAPGAAA